MNCAGCSGDGKQQSILLKNFTQQFEGGESFVVVSVDHDRKLANSHTQNL